MNTGLYAKVMAAVTQQTRRRDYPEIARVVQRVCDRMESQHAEALIKEVLQRLEERE